MNRLMVSISLVLGISLVVLGGSVFAYPPGYWEHYASRFSQAGEARTSVYRPMSWNTVETRSLIGQRVNGRAGNYLGQISNLIVDQDNDRVALVVLSDVPGFGADRVAIPYGCLERTDNHTFTVRFPIMATASVNNRKDPDLYLLHQYPTDSPLYSIPQPIDPNWVAEVYRTYGLAPYWAQKGGWAPSAKDFYQSTQLIGTQVRSPQGRVEARVTDVIIDSSSGHIVLLVLSDVKGMGDNRVAVPFGLVNRTSNGIFALNGTEDELASAPSFHAWDMNRRGYVAHVYRSFGVQPSWTGGGKAKAMDPYRWGGEAQDF
jgi:sporulation protein YlmC with PRC-barrel domain